MWGRGGAHSILRPWVPISSPLIHMVSLLPFLSYLADSKSVSVRLPVRPSDPDTTTNTNLRAIASSSGKKTVLCLSAENDIKFLYYRPVGTDGDVISGQGANPMQGYYQLVNYE